MSEVDDIILRHVDPDYDPAKAREYYLRTRELKGRKGPSIRTATGRPSSARPGTKRAAVVAPRTTDNPKVKAITAQVLILQASLANLRKKLAELVAKADANKPKAKSEGTSAPTKGKSDRELTAKQESDARKRSKEHYEKNKKPADSASKKPTATEQQEAIRAQISEAETKLRGMKDQIAKLRKASGSGKVPVTTTPTRPPDKAGRKWGDPEYGNDPPA